MAIDTNDEKLALIGLHMPFEDSQLSMLGSLANQQLLQLMFEYPTETLAPVVEEEGVPHRGAPRKRKRYWWEQEERPRFYLPPHRKREPEPEPLPHVAAIEDARAELAEVKRVKAAGAQELRRLSGALGNITKSARALERRIEIAEDITQVEEQYRRLGARLTGYIDRLDALKERRAMRMRDDEEIIMRLLTEID